MSELLTKRETAAAMGVSVRTLDSWLARGAFPPPSLVIAGRKRWRRSLVEDVIAGRFQRKTA